MSELVQCGEVDDDAARDRVDVDGRICRDVHLGGVDPSLRVEVRQRLAVITARPVEVDADARAIGYERALKRECAVRRRCPCLHRLLDQLIALRREVPPIDEDRNDRMHRPVRIRRGGEQPLRRRRTD